MDGLLAYRAQAITQNDTTTTLQNGYRKVQCNNDAECDFKKETHQPMQRHKWTILNNYNNASVALAMWFFFFKIILHILEWPLIMSKHTCVKVKSCGLISIFIRHTCQLDGLPWQWGSANSNTNKSVHKIWEKWAFCVHRKSLTSFIFRLVKKQQKQVMHLGCKAITRKNGCKENSH